MSDVSRRRFLQGTVAGTLGATVVTRLADPASAADGTQAVTGTPPLIDDRMRTPAAWRDFLADQDMVWTHTPPTFFDAPFLGDRKSVV